jgi:hypothetical protein
VEGSRVTDKRHTAQKVAHAQWALDMRAAHVAAVAAALRDPRLAVIPGTSYRASATWPNTTASAAVRLCTPRWA